MVFSLLFQDTLLLRRSLLATTDPKDGGGITSFPPDHDSGTFLVTKSHILLSKEFD